LCPPEVRSFGGDGDSGLLSITAKKMIPHPFDPINTTMERLALALGYASHGWEHYGQMVVYRRIHVPLRKV